MSLNKIIGGWGCEHIVSSRNDKGEYHREDGPAILYPSGYQEWWVNGLCHREDGPACFNPNTSYEEWRIDHANHRLDGPAMTNVEGVESWWVNGIEITHQIVSWIEENKFPHWKQWTDTQKIMFRLAFSGISS